MGEMMMTVTELNDILPCTLFNKIRGYNAKMRQEWERTRMATYIGLSPYMPKEKAPTLYEVFPLPWDGDVREEMMQKVKVDAEEARKKRQDTWAKVDALKKELKVKRE